jgi:hypothetical protein
VADRGRIEALGELVRTVGRELDYPATPSFVPGVLERIEAELAAARRPRTRFATWDRRRVVVAVALGVLAALALAFGARLVLGAAEIRVQPGVSPTGPPLRPGGLGEAGSTAEVAAAVGFEMALPAGPPPDEAYSVRTGDGRSAALLAWRSGPDRPPLPGTPWGLILLETRVDAETLTKTVGTFDDVREVTVRGEPAFWLDVPHELLVRTDDGYESFSVGGNVLIWTEGEITYRLETALGLRRALAMAESVG